MDKARQGRGMKDWILCILALTLVNFSWQLFGRHDWSIAFERSYFQAAAIIIYVIGLRH